MALSQNIKYFGERPTTIVMRSSTNFDGTAQTVDPALSPGVYTFPVQAAGGLFNFHEEPVEVLAIAYKGGGSLTVTKVLGTGTTILIATVVSDTEYHGSIQVAPGESLKLASAGGTNPVLAITSKVANSGGIL